MSSEQKKGVQIFICYRREDSTWAAGRIYDRLIQKYGKQAIFKDIDSIPIGVNFKQHINYVMGQCSVVLVLIGDNWAGEIEGTGARRIDDPRDFVRIEIEAALLRELLVIPLLVQNAKMPLEEHLPPTLKELAYRQGLMIGNDPHFHTDVDRLIKGLESHRVLMAQTEALESTSLSHKNTSSGETSKVRKFLAFIKTIFDNDLPPGG